MRRIPGLDNTNQSQFKQEYLWKEVNNNFYETTLRHKFKQGDRVRLKKTYQEHYGSLEFIVNGMEFSKENDFSEWRVFYQAPTHKDWIGEHKLELAERGKQ